MKQKNWFSIKRVQKNVYAIAEFNHFELVVSYLVLGKGAALLVDTGMGYSDIFAVVRSVTALPITVFLTHAHWDHIGGMNLFDTLFIYNDPFEYSLLAKGFSAEFIYELTDVTLFTEPFSPKTYTVSGRQPYGLLKDGQVLEIGGIEIHVLHTPGHTPGSVCYFLPKLGILLTGDTIYPGPLYAHLPESSLEAYAKSVHTLQVLVAKGTRLLPGHNALGATYNLLTEVVRGFDTILKDEKKGYGVKEYKASHFSILYYNL